MGEFIGKIEPKYGRWQWPLRVMKPGDYFVVDKTLRSTEEVRHLMSVRAAQLGVRFSVSAHPPEFPGYTKVEMIPNEAQEFKKPDGQIVDYGTARTKLLEWYGYQLDQMPFGPLAMRGEAEVAVEQIEEPPVRRIIFDAGHDRVGAILDKHEIIFIALPAGSSLASWKWKDELTLEEIMG